MFDGCRKKNCNRTEVKLQKRVAKLATKAEKEKVRLQLYQQREAEKRQREEKKVGRNNNRLIWA